MLIFGGTNNNFRIPPGDVGLFYAPGAGQPTVYKLFQGIGIDLNSYTLDKLPILTPDQYTQALATALGTAPDPYRNANFTGTANDYQNPRAFQAGLGADQQISRNWAAGIQLNYVNTVHLERNRDYNLPHTDAEGFRRPVCIQQEQPASAAVWAAHDTGKLGPFDVSRDDAQLAISRRTVPVRRVLHVRGSVLGR